VFAWALHNKYVTPTHSTLYIMAMSRYGQTHEALAEVQRLRADGHVVNAIAWCAVIGAFEKVRVRAAAPACLSGRRATSGQPGPRLHHPTGRGGQQENRAITKRAQSYSIVAEP
jgi:hypothetical protein